MSITKIASAQMIPVHVTEALMASSTSSEALLNLYAACKKSDPRYSIPYICRRAGIPSVGYFSDIIHNKRRLNIKYRSGILRAFALNGPAARYLSALIKVDNEKNAARAETLRRKLLVFRKGLAIEHRPVAEDTASFFLALELFCAFGLFQNKPTLQDLTAYFATRSSSEITGALATLEQLGLIKSLGGVLTLTHAQINFGGTAFSQIEYLKMAFKHGTQKVETWFDQRDCAMYESINISVKKSELKDKLERLREAVEALRFDLETDDADMLVRFNLQLYPVN